MAEAKSKHGEKRAQVSEQAAAAEEAEADAADEEALRERAEAIAAQGLAEIQQAEADEAIKEAIKEEQEALEAEKIASIEMDEANVAFQKFGKEEKEAQAAILELDQCLLVLSASERSLRLTQDQAAAATEAVRVSESTMSETAQTAKTTFEHQATLAKQLTAANHDLAQLTTCITGAAPAVHLFNPNGSWHSTAVEEGEPSSEARAALSTTSAAETEGQLSQAKTAHQRAKQAQTTGACTINRPLITMHD